MNEPRAAAGVPATVAGMLRLTAWPVTMALSLALLAALQVAGVPAQPAAFTAAGTGAAVVLILERLVPYRPCWHAAREELLTDLTFLAAVQVALPVGLGLAVVTGMQHWLAAHGIAAARAWPHHWPVAAQAVLVMLAADLLRYLLHVAAHRLPMLWRLHAVHHAPRKLHATNVGRFHPLEKCLQFLLDTLPFALLGVAPAVLAAYLVFYAVNGFFQHANADVRLGMLNWLVSGPELHRWHHSRRIEESGANYGNNLIVWDVLFGTRFLPAGRRVLRLGLQDRNWPQGFLCQLAAPFTRGRPGHGRFRSLRRVFAGTLLAAGMLWVRFTGWRRLWRAARDPRRAQLRLLQDILRRNRDTTFGTAHGFAAIRGHEEYMRRVPVQSYEALRPLIEQQDRAGIPALTADRPVMYARTSGTTAEPKLIPVTGRALHDQRRMHELFTFCLGRAVPATRQGRILAIVAPEDEGRTPGGRPFGSVSGQIYCAVPAPARERYVLPPEVFEVADHATRCRLILRLAAAVPDVTVIGCANPSTLLVLGETLRRHRRELLRDLAGGTFTGLQTLPAKVRDAVAPRLACDGARLAQLRAVLAAPAPTLAALWPGLRCVSTWTGGSCAIALDALRPQLPPDVIIGELGYLASELRATLPVDPVRRLCVPTLGENFFEFVERERWERNEPEFLLLDQLREGVEYHVFVTTCAGLYRYFMNDVVRVNGWFRATPSLEFVQKGKGVTSITGEKLCEGQVLDAVGTVLGRAGAAPRFWLMTAHRFQARYRLLVEAGGPLDAPCIAGQLDDALGARNIEYAGKRASGRLGAPEVVRLAPGTADAYRAHCVARGQRDGQFKFVALRYADEVDFDFECRRAAA